MAQTPICEIVPTSGYVHLVCNKCGSMDCVMDFRGLDPVMVLMNFSCPNCGDLGTWKVHNAGAGFYQRP